jgi:hypothetical protein
LSGSHAATGGPTLKRLIHIKGSFSMKHNKLLLTLLVVAAATVAIDGNAKKPSTKPVAVAREAEVVAVDVPPPSGSWETMPAPANGHIWSGGYYVWKNDHYVWKAGEWILEKAGMEYRQHKWEQRADGKWMLTGGDWVTPQEKTASKK